MWNNHLVTVTSDHDVEHESIRNARRFPLRFFQGRVPSCEIGIRVSTMDATYKFYLVLNLVHHGRIAVASGGGTRARGYSRGEFGARQGC